jgi:hypothetical protein
MGYFPARLWWETLRRSPASSRVAVQFPTAMVFVFVRDRSSEVFPAQAEVERKWVKSGGETRRSRLGFTSSASGWSLSLLQVVGVTVEFKFGVSICEPSAFLTPLLNTHYGADMYEGLSLPCD